MKRKPETTAFWVDRLPHWEVEDGRYFITIHVAGAIPLQGRRQMLALAERLRKVPDRDSPEWLKVYRAIFREMEDWLDRVQWSPILQTVDVAEMVVEAIEHRQHRGDWNIFEYVVMPTHVHLFAEIGGAGLKDTLVDFKRWTGHQGAKILGLRGERFWQRDWFDHWSRSDEEDDRIAKYIRENPVKAKLVQTQQEWKYGSCGRK